MSENLGQQPPLEKLVEQAANNGWEFFAGPLGKPDARQAVSIEQSKRMATLASALYQVPEFCELLNFLAETTLHRQTFVTPFIGIDPMQAYCYGVFREGQNSLVFSIFKLIADGREQELKGRDA
jgi:hypothetical protein